MMLCQLLQTRCLVHVRFSHVHCACGFITDLLWPLVILCRLDKFIFLVGCKPCCSCNSLRCTEKHDRHFERPDL